VDIASLADKKKIQVRWHFSQAKWDYWFAIDQVRVSGEPAPRPPPCTGFPYCWQPFGNGLYTVQQSDDLGTGTWVNVPGTWPITATCWCINDMSGVRKRFYRVMSE
jgi:hypothetical protein